MKPSSDPNARKALEERFHRLMPAVESQARRMDGDDDDLRSVGLAALWQCLLKRADCQDGYYLIAARNAMIDYLRQEILRKSIFNLEVIRGKEDNISAPERLWLYNQLELLPEHLRLPLVLHFLDGMSTAEIAQRFGMSQRSIQLAIRKAKIFMQNANEDCALGQR